MAAKQHAIADPPTEQTTTEPDDRTLSMIGERLANALELGRAEPHVVVDRLRAIDRYLSFGHDPEGAMHDLVDRAYDATPYGNGQELRREELHERLRALVEQLLERADTMAEVRTAGRLLDPDFAR